MVPVVHGPWVELGSTIISLSSYTSGRRKWFRPTAAFAHCCPWNSGGEKPGTDRRNFPRRPGVGFVPSSSMVPWTRANDGSRRLGVKNGDGGGGPPWTTGLRRRRNQNRGGWPRAHRSQRAQPNDMAIKTRPSSIILDFLFSSFLSQQAITQSINQLLLA